MRQKSILRYGWGLLAVTFLISCGNPANPPPPKWTAENPNAGPTTAAAPKPAPSAAAKPAPGTTSSLDALRSGDSATGGPLKDVSFGFDSAALSEGARATLKANADWLKGNPAARVQIEGHCDERGAADRCQARASGDGLSGNARYRRQSPLDDQLRRRNSRLQRKNRGMLGKKPPRAFRRVTNQPDLLIFYDQSYCFLQRPVSYDMGLFFKLNH